jgi:hypothetical protein
MEQQNIKILVGRDGIIQNPRENIVQKKLLYK